MKVRAAETHLTAHLSLSPSLCSVSNLVLTICFCIHTSTQPIPVTSPSLIECSKRIPSASFEKKNSLVVIETLEQTKIIDDNTGSFLRAALTDGTSLFIIAVFCCTPTYIGMVLSLLLL